MHTQATPPATTPKLIGAKLLGRILGYTPEGVRQLARRGDIPSLRIRHASGRAGYRFDPAAVAEAISDDEQMRERFLRAVAREGEDLLAALGELLRHLPDDEPIATDTDQRLEVLEAPDGRRWFRHGEQLYTFEGEGVLRVDRAEGHLERFQHGQALGTPRLPAFEAFAQLPSYPDPK